MCAAGGARGRRFFIGSSDAMSPATAAASSVFNFNVIVDEAALPCVFLPVEVPLLVVAPAAVNLFSHAHSARPRTST